jgi:RNA polymerase-binding transcription factor DksA
MTTKKTAKEKVETNKTKNIAMNGTKLKKVGEPRGKKETPIDKKEATTVATKQTSKKITGKVAEPNLSKENKTRKAEEKPLAKSKSSATKGTTKTTSKDKKKTKEEKKELAKPKVTTKTTTNENKTKAKKEIKKATAKPQKKVEPKQVKEEAYKTEATKEAKDKTKVEKETKQTKTKKSSKKQDKITAEAQKPKPTVRYSDEDLEIFRKRILEVKHEALEELNMLRDRLEDLNSYDLAEEGSIYSMHMAEQGSEIFEKEKVYAQIQRINEYIKKLDEALQRINDKTYGICRVCGILIAKERLLAVPITTLSASYKIHKKCPEDGIDRIEPVNK